MTPSLLLAATFLSTSLSASTEIPLREHPRPDFERPAWVNLNGAWDFDFDAADAGEKEQWFLPGKHPFSRQIVVPFPWESRLSGIGDTEYRGVAWYSRRLTLPSGDAWTGRDLWLIVGACDWEAKVWINGHPVGEHVGGYVPIEVNLGAFAKPGDTATITIRAVDLTKDEQPTGKQINWYTRTSGIWQTVYLEPRPKSYISALLGTPKVAEGAMEYEVAIEHAGNHTLTLRSPEGRFKPAELSWSSTAAAESPSPSPLVRESLPAPTYAGIPSRENAPRALMRIRFPIDRPQLWSPDSPTLYPITFELKQDGRIIDTVNSYFGLRDISIQPAEGRDYPYICLNGKPIYLRGALHQSFHPAGIYQYPSDAVVRSDYELCKQIGINFLRIHIKIPTPRELYWADKLGVLIMQDMPCYWVHTPQAQAWWEQMLRASIARDYNHPAIFSWVNFNETWGIGHGDYKPDRQTWVEEMYQLTRKLDPTRLVEDNSPCRYDHVATDINSWHFYINDYTAARQHIREVVDKTHPGSTFNYIGGRKQDNDPLINSEYGGIGAGQGDQDVSWCFKYLTNELRLHDKICGYIYTELSDIEWEHNGFVNYDRTPKQFGYDFWHPDLRLADLNGADFVVIDAPPMIELKPDERREVAIKVSHFSQHAATKPTLRYRTDWIDGAGKRHTGAWQTQPAEWAPFKVVDQRPIHLDAGAAGSGCVGALLVELLDGETVLARNYVNLLVDRGSQPRVESVGPDTLALRFSPMDFAAWTFAAPTSRPAAISADKVSGQGAGHGEYHLRLPDNINLDRVKELTILAELSSKAGDQKLDWPSKTKPGDYPQTDVRTWPSHVVLSVNGQKLAQVELPDDPADSAGAMSHHRGYQGSHGYLVRETLAGTELAKVRAVIGADRIMRIRFEVPSDAAHRGGLSIFGQNIGCYPLDPTVLLVFDGDQPLGAGYRSEQPLATEVAVRVLIPSADYGRHTWQYTTDRPTEGWAAPAFDDHAWTTGQGGFGGRGTLNAIVSTRWNKPDIWLRTRLTVDDPAAIGAAQWRIYHDEDIDIHVNGTKVLELKGFEAQYIDVPLDKTALAAFRKGANTIAVHCRQNSGGQNVDVGLMVVKGK